MSHTQGKLRIDGPWIETEHGHAVAYVGLPDMSEEDARRLVACWNACDGLSQDALDGGWTALGISQYAKRLEGERDELLAALRNGSTAKIEAILSKYKVAESHTTECICSHGRHGKPRQPEIDALKAERNAHRDNAQQLAEENAALKAEVARLQKDGEHLLECLKCGLSTLAAEKQLQTTIKGEK